MSILFLLSFLFALFTGQVQWSEASSMSSDSPAPEVSRRADWPCHMFPGDDETCFISFNADGTITTGP